MLMIVVNAYVLMIVRAFMVSHLRIIFKRVEAGNNVVTFLLISFPLSFSSFSRDFNRQHSRPVMSYDDIQPVANEYIRYKVIQISL